MVKIFNMLEAPKLNKGWKEAWYDVPIEVEQAVLLHGTSDVFLEDIIQQGIKPRGLTGNNNWGISGLDSTGLDSNPKLSYFGDDFNAMRAALQATHKYGGKPTFITVILKTEDLVPDEDAINTFNAKGWRDSLSFGRCATKKIISKSAFINAKVYGERSVPSCYSNDRVVRQIDF